MVWHCGPFDVPRDIHPFRAPLSDDCPRRPILVDIHIIWGFLLLSSSNLHLIAETHTYGYTSYDFVRRSPHTSEAWPVLTNPRDHTMQLTHIYPFACPRSGHLRSPGATAGRAQPPAPIAVVPRVEHIDIAWNHNTRLDPPVRC